MEMAGSRSAGCSVGETDHDLLFRGVRHHLARCAAAAWRDIDGGMPVARWLWHHFPEVDQFADVVTLAWAGNLSCSAPGFRERFDG